MPEPFTCGLVLAAGASTRLGQPKQLLPFGRATLLDHVLDVARDCGLHQLVCVVPGDGWPEIDFTGVAVVHNRASGQGCATSIAAGLGAVDARADVLVLLLGDQPGVSSAAVRALVAQGAGAPVAACRYDDGRGHPLAFARPMFGHLRAMHGDKAVWKLMDRWPVRDVPVPGPIPRDIDTWEDYAAVAPAAPGAGA
jgi:molybdenum cofactor cytidylyltransferase